METSMENVKMERYPEYKDSGVEWIGPIPAHWEVLKSKYLWKEMIDLSPTGEETLLSVSQYTGVNANDNDSRSGSLIGYKKVCENDLVINIMLAWLGGLGLSGFNGIVSPAYAVYRLTKDFDAKFIHYLYRTSTYLDEFARRSKGVVPSRWRMYTDDFGQVLTLLPSKSEQTRIANFLDRKTAQIDQAIAQKERLIELLKERRQILIHNAVTRGLDPNVRMKDSGVEWIGDVPEHWEVKRLKYLGNIKYGLGQPPKESENGLPLIRATNIERGNIVEKGLIYVDPSDIPWQRDPELKENDIIIVRSGAYTGDSAIIPPKYSGAIAGYDMVMTPISINAKFLAFALLSKYVLNDQLFLLRMRAAQPHLNAEELGETLILLPSEFEQQEIVNAISNFTLKIITAIDCKQAEIEKLKEYKATLINSAVTGKIKL
jgi:type I restriction enzyme S subunit